MQLFYEVTLGPGIASVYHLKFRTILVLIPLCEFFPRPTFSGGFFNQKFTFYSSSIAIILGFKNSISYLGVIVP